MEDLDTDLLQMDVDLDVNLRVLGSKSLYKFTSLAGSAALKVHFPDQ